MTRKLSRKQELFCKEYIIDFNGARSAISAGYSENTARSIASNLLTKVNIQVRIAELNRRRMKELELDAKYVLKRLVEIDQMDVADIMTDSGDIKPVIEWPESWRRTISGFDVTEMFADGNPVGILKKIRLPDKLRNLELLGKHIDISAFTENQKVEISVNPLESIFAEIEDEARSSKE